MLRGANAIAWIYEYWIRFQIDSAFHFSDILYQAESKCLQNIYLFKPSSYSSFFSQKERYLTNLKKQELSKVRKGWVLLQHLPLSFTKGNIIIKQINLRMLVLQLRLVQKNLDNLLSTSPLNAGNALLSKTDFNIKHSKEIFAPIFQKGANGKTSQYWDI